MSPPQRIALTGASGFLGAAILRRLLAEGYSPKLLSRGNVVAPEGCEIIPGDLDDQRSLARLVEGCDAVIHCAGLTGARSRAEFRRVNVEGTTRLAIAALKAGVPRFLLISSLAAREPLLSDYAMSKRDAEDALATMPGLAWDALRPPAIYGPGDRHFLSLFTPLVHGIALTPGGPEARASVIHVEDAAAAAVAWLNGPPPSQTRYALDDGSGGRSWRELLTIAARLIGRPPHFITPPYALLWLFASSAALAAKLTGRPPFLTPGKLRELCHPDWSANATPLTLAGWKPQFSFEEGLKGTFAWYRAQGLLPAVKNSAG